ncbi:PQQ-binding-like beta-propeller repeat protein [Lacunimicrobium album]
MSDVDPTSSQPTQERIMGRYRPLRVWPAIILLVGMIITRNLPAWWENGPTNLWASAAFGPALCGIFVLLWWLTASRATWQERLGGFLAVIVAFIASLVLMHPSMHGVAVMVLAIPIGMAAFAVGAAVMSRTLSYKRTIFACLMATVGFSSMTLFKASGMWGNFAVDLTSRFSETSEEQIAARDPAASDVVVEQFAGAAVEQTLLNPEWPGFRGPRRDGIQYGTVLPASFTVDDVKELWRVPVGPSWSSFVVAGKLLFTQEQRGEQEMAVCYDADTGGELWAKPLVEGRFDDPLGGPGPRATPTLAVGALYVMGALGDLVKLDPRTGQEIWKKDIKVPSDATVPMWGFSSSPLVTGDHVIVYAGGKSDKGLLAFDTNTGDLKWSAPAGEFSYSSPQLATLLGEEYLLSISNTGVDFLVPATGEVRYQYSWPHEGYRADQPAILSEDSLIIPTGMGTGTRRIKLSKDGEGKLVAGEVWTTMNMKPDFNDVVTFDGHLYGFDNTIFACLNLETGERAWKGGRYGKGQQLLLADSGMIVVVTEEGELKFVKPDPKKLTEVVSMKPLNGRTWNHPVVVGNRIYLRNAAEAVCLELPVVEPKPEVAVAAP